MKSVNGSKVKLPSELSVKVPWTSALPPSARVTLFKSRLSSGSQSLLITVPVTNVFIMPS